MVAWYTVDRLATKKLLFGAIMSEDGSVKGKGPAVKGAKPIVPH